MKLHEWTASCGVCGGLYATKVVRGCIPAGHMRCDCSMEKFRAMVIAHRGAPERPINCKGCKYWTGEKNKHLRVCEQPKAYIGYHQKAKDTAKDGLIIEGDEGWGWYVGPEFGCVHFEAICEAST